MGLYKGGLIQGWAYIRGGLIHGRSFVLVINKSDINKLVMHKQENKQAAITGLILIRGTLYSGGLIFGGGAYIWNEVSVSTCGGLIHGGGLIFGGGL